MMYTAPDMADIPSVSEWQAIISVNVELLHKEQVNLPEVRELPKTNIIEKPIIIDLRSPCSHTSRSVSTVSAGTPGAWMPQ